MESLVTKEDKRAKIRKIEMAREEALLYSVLKPAGLHYSRDFSTPKTIKVEIHKVHCAFFPKKEWGTIEGAERVKDISLVLKDLFAEYDQICGRMVFRSMRFIQASPVKLKTKTSYSASLTAYNAGAEYHIDIMAEAMPVRKQADEFFVRWKETMITLHEQYGPFSMDIR